jgi:type I restriction enzyme M protein
MFIGKAEATKNDYNISPSRYIQNGVAEEYIPVEDILVELAEVEARAKEADKNLQKVLKELEI